MTRMKQIASTLAIAASLFLVAAQPASATVVLTFGQVLQTNTVTAVNNNAGSTTITAFAGVQITQIDAGVPTPILAVFTLNATSVGAAQIIAGNIVQMFSGVFTITNGGTNYLSGTFTDAVFGAIGGAGLTLSAAQPPDTDSGRHQLPDMTIIDSSLSVFS